uniref:Ubiquitin carboxyl-terminal hydrolase 48 n=1 Tax=Anser cygnoides TaxID=8845 RepID=A0A8B9EWI2_ANSCY
MSPGSPSITGVPWCHWGPLASYHQGSLPSSGSPGTASVPKQAPGTAGVPWHRFGPQVLPASLGIGGVPWCHRGVLAPLGSPSITQGPLAPPSISVGSPSTPGVPKHACGPLASARASLRVPKHCQGPQAPPEPPAVPIPIPSSPSGWQWGQATVPACGVTGPAVLRSAEPVVLGRWHRVMAERVHKDGTLVVDGGAPVQRSSPGKSQGLNLRSPLYLGGTEPPLQPPTNASFQGCIGEVSINGKKVDLSYSFLRSRGVGQCGQSSPCLHAPCLHGGRCLPLPDGSPPFRCLCPPGFSGPRCERAEDRCLQHNPCLHGGTCKGNACICPEGYTGPYCQHSTALSELDRDWQEGSGGADAPGQFSAAFRDGSYLALPGHLFPRGAPDAQEAIELELRTDSAEGLLLWHGAENGKAKDFVGLGLKDGHLVFSYQLGSGEAVIVSEDPVNDGEWHRVTATRQGRRGWLQVDGEEPVHGESPGANVMANTQGSIYVGGAPDPRSLTAGKFLTGVTGRNCRGNPNCLVGIGEHVWLGEIDENSFHNIDDPNCERRKKNAFVGLTNLGATCYVNTFLQMWFLNLELRQALYLCPSTCSERTAGEGIPKDKDYEPQTICEHLQYLFALLQNSKRRYIDPSGFVKALGLDTGQQQDAQEFSKLFMSLLEDTLSKQKNPDVRNIVQKQFCGEYAYVTVCNQCGRESKLVSKFYELELNIQGHKQLTDCITEFLKEEKLEGDNRYFCETCQSKQNATRKIRLLSLPCTLNLQLMRFVFDRQTGHKKKLNTYIGFSELLDMEPFMEQKSGVYVYELSAVLIHRGVSAYSGHYIAHVKDPQTGEWYKFNDEDIEKMEGKKLQLGIEEDLAEPSKSQTRKPKCGKGTHCSRNAYMLVYRLQTREKSLTVEVPAFLQELVERDNCKFEEWCNEMAEMRKQSVARGKIKHEEVKELYQRLPAEAGSPYDFISLEWLQKWLDESTPPKPIDNTACLCSHGKLHPDKICIMKRISEYVADFFYRRYGGGPRLNVKALCKDCVVERCRILRLKNQLNEDYKTVTNLLKITVKGNDGFWVGKASLRSWRQLALEQLNEQDEDAEHSNGKMNGNAQNKDESNEEKREEEEELNFNEDIVCPHGDLCISENERRVVSKEAWKKLKQYFPKAPEFPNNKECCSQCKILEREGEENEALHKMMASEQKTSLQNLFHDKCRPCLGSWPQETDELYIVSQFFVEEWRKFVRRPTRCSPVSSVGNSALLCPHGGLMFTYASMTKEDSKLIALIWPSEWERIQKLFVVDHVIKITRTQAAGADPESALYTSEPKLCPECREGLLCQQQRDLREYTQATIYIHKVVDNKKTNGGAKRQKISHQNYITYQKQGIRRSTRHRKVRGEKALLVSANQTLKELKIQIMHAFSVAPFDQNLSIDGKILSDDTATLGSLGVIPESVILLKADEPIADYAAMDDVMQVCMPEEGFKGTGLLGH